MSKQKTLGTALENRVAKRAKQAGLDAKRQPGSGIYAEHPADVEVERILVECKVRSTTLNAKGAVILSIDVGWLRKVQQRAAAKHEQGIVVVNPKGSTRPLVLCDLDWLLSVLTHSTFSGVLDKRKGV